MVHPVTYPERKVISQFRDLSRYHAPVCPSPPQAADVVTPIGVHDLYRNDELLSMLTKYILRYPEFPRWLLKVWRGGTG